MDMVLMGLLLVALWYGTRLNARLKALRSGQESFIKAVAELDQAAIKAHTSLRELHTNADESQELLHGRILAARDLLSKLESQINRAERACRYLEEVNVAPVTRILEPDPESPLSVARSNQRDSWAAARGAEGRQTYAGRGRPAFEDENADEDLGLPLSGRLRDMNDRLSRVQRSETPPAPRAQLDEQAAVSAIGLEAINEMLRAFADPEDVESQRMARRASAETPSLSTEGRRSAVPDRSMAPDVRSDSLRLSRSRLPALDDELFDAGQTAAPDRPAPEATVAAPKPARPLFRRLR